VHDDVKCVFELDPLAASRRMALPAGINRRRRRRKTDGAPLSQPKLSAAAEIFTAHRKRNQNSWTVKHQQ